LTIESPVLNGIQFEGAQAIQGIEFDGVTIHEPATNGLWVLSGVTGSAKASHVVVSGAAADHGMGLKNDSPTTFTFQRGDGDVGW